MNGNEEKMRRDEIVNRGETIVSQAFPDVTRTRENSFWLVFSSCTYAYDNEIGKRKEKKEWKRVDVNGRQPEEPEYEEFISP